jgi:tetratricopeptide (TPR) repeat protein
MKQPPAAPACRYRAFISYSHRDASWAAWLHKALETYRVPSRLVGKQTAAGVTPRRLAPIFRDRDELASATDLGSKVREALAQSANLIVICSPHAAASHWVQQEVLAFKRLGRSANIYCLIVDGEPNASQHADQADQECFVSALRFQLGADGELGSDIAEPIAADARASKDGRRNAKLKLIAGMLAISFDSLKQRELQRRNRRLSMITAAALAVAAVTASLAIVAMKARHAADVARVAAERRQRQAEDLIDFMLGDLNDKLHRIEHLDIMEDVDNKAMKYFAAMPTTDVTEQALAQRAKALERIGSVREEQGHLPDAIASYRAAAILASSLAHKSPTDAAKQLQYARILAFIGRAHWFEGELDAAQTNFEEAQNVLLRAEPYAKDDLELQLELEIVDNNMGHVLEARGRLDEALVSYRSALALADKLVAAKPDRADWATELGGAHNNIGKLALLHGDLAGAIAEYGSDDAIETALSEQHPDDFSQRDSMLTVRAILGRTLALVGDDETGMRHMQQAVDIADGLLKSSPNNSGFQEDVARYSAQLARLKRLNGDLPAATALTTRSLALAAVLIKQSPTDAGLARLQAEVQTEHAAQLLAAGQADAAHAQLQLALDTLRPMLVKQPHERSVVLANGNAQLLLAAASADPDTSAQLRREVVRMAQGQPSGQGDPRLLSMQARALLALGDAASADALVQQLWRSGYRDAEWLAVLRHAHVAYPLNTDFQKKLVAQNSGDR